MSNTEKKYYVPTWIRVILIINVVFGSLGILSSFLKPNFDPLFDTIVAIILSGILLPIILFLIRPSKASHITVIVLSSIHALLNLLSLLTSLNPFQIISTILSLLFTYFLFKAYKDAQNP